MEIIETAEAIIDEYAAQGFTLTLRQLYYQFVSRAIIPNKQQEYQKLGNLISAARLAGLIDWDSIIDRTRELRGNSHWSNPKQIIQACASQYMIDKWEGQEYRPEVWIEKDALVGVIEGVCNKMDVKYFSCRGYTSQSEMWSASQRLIRFIEQGQIPVIIHLGDHDPSGIDMTRDIIDRMTLFGEGDHVEVIRIALNMDQIQEFNPPPNPAKITDSRAAGYIRKHGRESWELDALDPKVIAELIREKITDLIDWDKYEARQRKESDERLKISSLVNMI
jgi:hypothetical protein